MVNKPACARQKITFISELNADTFKIVATAAVELVSVTVTGGGSAATFRLLDLKNGGGFVPGQVPPGYNLKDGQAFAVESSNTMSFTPAQPSPYKNGLIIVCEQGEGSNAEITITINGD